MTDSTSLQALRPVLEAASSARVEMRSISFSAWFETLSSGVDTNVGVRRPLDAAFFFGIVVFSFPSRARVHPVRHS